MITAEELLDSTFFIDYAVEDIKNKFEDSDDIETDPYHFVDKIQDWLDRTEPDTDDLDAVAQKWLEDEGYDLIEDRIHYFG